MEYREDGSAIIPDFPVENPAAPATDAPPLVVPRLMMASIAGAPQMPDTSQDESYARILQEEADAEARALSAPQLDQQWHDAAAEYDLFGDGDLQDWSGSINVNDLDEMITEEDDKPVHVSQAARDRRARLQREIFGDDDEEQEEVWDFNGVEWIKVPVKDVITAYGMGACVKTMAEEEEDAPAVPIHVHPTNTVFSLQELCHGELATGNLAQRSDTPRPFLAVTSVDVADVLVPALD